MNIDLSAIDKTMLQGSVSLITDGSSGIGEALVQVFSQAGAHVAVNVRGKEQHAKIRAVLEKHGTPYKVFAFPSLGRETIAQMTSDVSRELGRIEILVNLSDYEENIPFWQTDEDKWATMLDAHLTNAYRFCSAVVPGMIEAGYGKIVNISSLSAKTGGYITGAGVHYCAANNGLIGLSRGLAIQLAPYGITVNSVCPSLVDGEAEKYRNAEDILEVKKQLPFSRFADPMEIAGGALFLASPYTGWIAGYSLDINGGLFMD